MPQIYGRASVDAAPSEVANAANAQIQTDEFGGIHTRQELLAWAEQGSYFRAVNATLGTGIGSGIQTSWSATANALLVMRNGSTTKKIIPHYIRLINTVAPASATSCRMAIAIDTGNRYSSGGTDLSAQIVNAHSGLAPTTAVDVLRFAAVTAAAAVAARYVSNLQIKTQAAPAITLGDEIILNFLCPSQAGGQLLSGAPCIQITKDIGPVILSGQNHCLVVHMWNPGNAATAPSWEVEMAWWER
jgi:hypothetical protein